MGAHRHRRNRIQNRAAALSDWEMVGGDSSDYNYTSPIQPSSSSSISSFSDWDRPFTEQELQDIDALFQSASSSSSSSQIKINHPKDDDDFADNPPKSRRRLPDSIFQKRASASASSFANISSSFLSPCPINRLFNISHSSTPAKSMMKYPEMTFGGHIVYSRTVYEVEKATKDLLNFVEAKKKQAGRAVLGFDIEWKPTFRRGISPGKAAVMQICGDASKCHVMHIIHSGIPLKLRSLLEDPTLIKVGVCIANDAFKVLKDHNVSIEALEDLSDLANQKLSGDPKKWSLASLTETVICKQLPKPTKIRLGNWEASVLRKEQLQYAATDAFTSWYLYEALKSLPDVVDDQTKELQVAAQE